ncbi:hypothetical protein K6K41_15970 [Chenggangzhangella methanolivorans]|uniref:Uncharacterized protein n=2 Tax=Chenggangzhangella methanolivorans TaxID=1437009 RepID=A0A9E6RJ33_9HYPH|nr:hypothetical protein K6K41_15970 [Chenggangzhangella methanolivorans]
MKNYFACAVVTALSIAFALSSADAANRKVNIRNKTSQTMTEFYASNTGSQDWEEDILGSQELEPGEKIEIDIDDGSGKCKFDFQGVFADGEKVIKRNINVCQIETFSFTE